jgi:protein involved in ribonucleotide reduction
MKKTTLAMLVIAPLALINSSFISAAKPDDTKQIVQNQPKYNISVASAKREIALELSRQYIQVLPTLQSDINRYNLTVNADQVLQSSGIATKALHKSEQAIRSAKGLPTKAVQKSTFKHLDNPNLVQFRLADASMLSDWQQGVPPLFAFEPEGNDKDWANIEAYDVNGNIQLLDVYQLPDRPVFVVELDKQQTIREGLAVMRKILAQSTNSEKQLKSAHPQLSVSKDEDKPISTTLIDQISLQYDQEPWISGAAEVYAIVNGVNPTRKEPVLDIIEMPYLDYAEKEYYPNQIVIHWERYRWAAADIILMEQDDGTNYKDLATLLVSAAETILKSIPDPEVQGFAIIGTITNGIIKALPDAWFTNDDDFVDAYYTLQEGKTYINHYGSGGNARATFRTLVIDPR